MQVYKETIWHFTCQSCNGFWTVAASDKWVPKELFCTHCGSKRTHNKELIEWVDDDNDYIPTRNDSQHENYLEFEKEFLKEDKDELCSCGHNPIECDCAAGCKCGCRKRYLRAY